MQDKVENKNNTSWNNNNNNNNTNSSITFNADYRYLVCIASNGIMSLFCLSLKHSTQCASTMLFRPVCGGLNHAPECLESSCAACITKKFGGPNSSRCRWSASAQLDSASGNVWRISASSYGIKVIAPLVLAWCNWELIAAMQHGAISSYLLAP